MSKHDEVMDELAHLRGQLHELKTEHDRWMRRMFREHHHRCRLLDEVIRGQRERDARLQSLLDHLAEEDDGWWRRGEAPPWT